MNYQLNFRQLQYFLAVAEELHFRKAAERLFISQPGLSKQIKELEDQLGVQLFERNTRKVVLTPPGIYLKEEITHYLRKLDQIIGHTQLIDQGKQGNLNLGYVGSAMQKIIPDLLISFRKLHPKIIFNLKEMDNQKQIQGLLVQELDLAFVRLENIPRGLEYRAVLKEPFCLVLPKNHPLDQSNFKSLVQLKDEPFILFDQKYSPSYYQKVLQLFKDSGFSPIVSHNTIHSNTIYKLVAHHLGISIVPKSLQMKSAKGVKFIEMDHLPQRTVLSAVWNSNNRNPALINIIELIEG
jgi:DNA-binding transcriptional LysR family regulator